MIIPSIILKSLFLIPLLLIGIITSYSDIKYGKIRNIHLISGLLYVFFLYLFLLFYSYFVIHQPSNLKYLVDLIINGSISFFIVYLLWYFNLWAAGDAKLFFIYSLLIPLEYYSKNYAPFFPSSTLLVDTFLFICLSFFLKIFINIFVSFLKYLRKPFSPVLLLKKINHKSFKNIFLETGELFLVCICFLIIMEIVMKGVSLIFKTLPLNSFFIKLFFFILQIVLFRKFFKNKRLIIFIVIGGLLCGLALIILNQIPSLIMIIKSSLFLVLFIGIGVPLIYSYIDNQEIKRIKIEELRPGDFLSTQSLFIITDKHKGQAKANGLALSCSDGLIESQVKIIQELYKEDFKKEMYVCRTFPFAPFMFSAFIFNIILKSSFLFFLLRLWGLF